jgi:hypothetical protein
MRPTIQLKKHFPFRGLAIMPDSLQEAGELFSAALVEQIGQTLAMFEKASEFRGHV